MGQKGFTSKFSTMGVPKDIVLNWRSIEENHGSPLSQDAREDIEHAFKFYSSTKASEKLPMSALQGYARKLETAFRALERLPASAKHSLMFSKLSVLVNRTWSVAKPHPNEAINDWNFLILQLCEALGYLNKKFQNTTLTVNSTALPPRYACLKIILDQANVHEHFSSDAAFSKAIVRVVQDFQKSFDNSS